MFGVNSNQKIPKLIYIKTENERKNKSKIKLPNVKKKFQKLVSKINYFQMGNSNVVIS